MLNKHRCRRGRRLVLLALGLLHQIHGTAAAPNSAEIVSITGKAESRTIASAPWSPAQSKQLLYGGNFVRTLDESSLALLFADKTQLRLSRNSMFEIKGVGDGKATDTTVSLLKGKSWMQSKSVPNKMKVETPSGTAGIHGTDWVMEVDDTGVTTLTVLSGEVEFVNAHGSVRVRTDEQSVTEPGRAPQKRLLQNSRERVQWVTSHRVDPARYPELLQEPAFKAIHAEVLAQRMGPARQQTEGIVQAATGPAAVWLLASDFALSAGELALATERLTAGSQRFPNDDRFVAYKARVALLSGDWDLAREIVTNARQRFPQSTELALVGGELARLDGDGARAVQLFSEATQRAPGDYRAWHGLGSTYAEQENFGPARDALLRAVELAAGVVAPLAELGALETRAHRIPDAARAIDQSLEWAPDDYVAWTSRGILLLSQGSPEAALDAFLKAGVLEPRYAKAQIHAAIAWYQLGRTDAALAALTKAKALDPNDPLPYFYEAQIQRDELNPMDAIAAARAAMDRFTFVKSLGPIATDRQGNASLGAAYALFGLESWAKRVSAQTQHPFFAGSYLFSAARSTESFVKNSALVQGYLTEPTLFGASPQRSTLLANPGNYVAAELGTVFTDAYSSITPTVVANGYATSPIPLAGFVQLDAPRFQSGNVAFAANAPSLTTALGFRPHAQWGIFLYRDEFRPRIDEVELDILGRARIHGNVVRTDLGSQWQIDPATAMWLRIGQGSDQTEVSSNVRSQTRTYHRQDQDSGFRLTGLRDGGEWTIGLEGGRASKPSMTRSSLIKTQTMIDVQSDAAGERLYASWKGGTKNLRVQADLDYGNYRFTQELSTTTTFFSNGRTLVIDDPVVERRLSAWSPRLGLAWAASPANTYRIAWQEAMRPATSVSLAPLDTVGISLDVPGLQPGGKLKRLRAQGEWELKGAGFLTVFADHRDIDNLHDSDGSLLNVTSSLAQYDRLRQQSVCAFESPEALEGSSTFAAGRVQSAGVVFEQIATEHLSWTASYVRAETTNTVYPGALLPRFPKHTLGLGITWFAPQRWVLHAYAAGRSERSVNDAGSQVLDPDWDVSVNATWQDASKRKLFEVSAKGLGRKDESVAVGVRGAWRF